MEGWRSGTQTFFRVRVQAVQGSHPSLAFCQSSPVTPGQGEVHLSYIFQEGLWIQYSLSFWIFKIVVYSSDASRTVCLDIKSLAISYLSLLFLKMMFLFVHALWVAGKKIDATLIPFSSSVIWSCLPGGPELFFFSLSLKSKFHQAMSLSWSLLINFPNI